MYILLFMQYNGRIKNAMISINDMITTTNIYI